MLEARELCEPDLGELAEVEPKGPEDVRALISSGGSVETFASLAGSRGACRLIASGSFIERAHVHRTVTGGFLLCSAWIGDFNLAPTICIRTFLTFTHLRIRSFLPEPKGSPRPI